MHVETRYFLNRERIVGKIEFASDGQYVIGELSTNPVVDDTVVAEEDGGASDKYVFTSRLHFDTKEVKADRLISLADVILQAHILLGVIPPQELPSVPCNNKH